MNQTDLHNSIAVEVGIALTAVPDGQDVVGAIIDTNGSQALEYIMQVGAYTDGDVQLLIEGSNAANMAGAVEIADDYLIGTEADTLLSAAGISKIGVVAPFRYIRATAVTAAGSTLSVGAAAVKYGLRLEGAV